MRRKSKLYKNLYVFICSIGIIILVLFVCLEIIKISEKKEINTIEIPIQIEIQASTRKEDYKKETKLSLLMVGDALIHSAVYGDAKTKEGYNFEPMLENVASYIESFDLAFYNQESILGGKELHLSTYPRFNSPYEVGDAFRKVGFNIVSLANNHTLDRGEQAILNSRNYWNNHPEILVSGSNKSEEERNTPQIKEMNGIKYTMLAYTDTTNGLTTPNGKEYLVNRYSKEQVKEDIEKVRDKVDLLLVSMHFGTEYTHTPTKRQKEIASNLAELGVDIVIGHHPHVVEPIEFIGDTMVIYSLGNFISAQRGIDKLTGLMASVEVKKTTIGGKSEITLEHPTAELVYTASDRVNGYRKKFKLYRYQDLTEKILPRYKEYQEKYLNMVTKGNNKIETR